MHQPILAYTFGTLGAVCWSIQLLPQIWLNYRRHNATGLQPSMMMLWAWAGIPLGVYNITSNFNIPLLIQPQILTFLSLLTWIQCYYYEHHWTWTKSLCVTVPFAVAMGAIEYGLTVALQTGLDRGFQWPLTLMAVLAALLLALGVLRHYYDIQIHRTVRGISFLFVFIDALGDLFSIISVLFEPELDVLGLVIYGVELVLWIGIMAAGGYYNLIPWLKGQHRSWRGAQGSEEGAASVAIHDMPSSTSVFRTPSANMELRARTAVAAGDG